ncbi:MAG: D-alanyl-D-alanine carboxypeptidase/D-alanyl-D-alanine-endopeptidase (penicillin-binding protein 4) [Myxococcota bacterium]|jgi:D-alanyl-D-alanine carboxypeptidase/D-alanyl-D-alanine-endopeptidase (penicillin-binding protein 4)
MVIRSVSLSTNRPETGTHRGRSPAMLVGGESVCYAAAMERHTTGFSASSLNLVLGLALSFGLVALVPPSGAELLRPPAAESVSKSHKPPAKGSSTDTRDELGGWGDEADDGSDDNPRDRANDQPDVEPEANTPPPKPRTRELDESKRAKRFRRSLKRLLRRAPIRGVKLGIVVADARSGDEIGRRNPDKRLNPASTLKLVTSAVALDTLGPEHRFSTEILVDGDSIFLRGNGDPMLMTEDLEQLARDAAEAISDGTPFKRIVVDTSAFSGPDLPPGYSKKSTDASYRASTGAVALDYGAVRVAVKGTREGRAPSVEVTPPGGYLKLDNRARTVMGKGSTIRIKVLKRGERSVASITGKIGRRRVRGTWVRRRVESPPLMAGYALQHFLKQRGIKVKSVVRGTATDDARVVAKRRSGTLRDIIAAMNKHSNNFIAEMLVRAIVDGDGARTWSAGRKVVSKWLTSQLGIPKKSFTYRNGSGLYDGGRFSPRQVVDLLVHMNGHRDREVYRTSLAVAGGKEGTLSERLLGRRYRGRVIGKTGTLNDVSALSGYARGRSGRLVAFSIIMNRTNKATPSMRALQDKICALMIDTL